MRQQQLRASSQAGHPERGILVVVGRLGSAGVRLLDLAADGLARCHQSKQAATASLSMLQMTDIDQNKKVIKGLLPLYVSMDTAVRSPAPTDSIRTGTRTAMRTVPGPGPGTTGYRSRSRDGYRRKRQSTKLPTSIKFDSLRPIVVSCAPSNTLS